MSMDFIQKVIQAYKLQGVDIELKELVKVECKLPRLNALEYGLELYIGSDCNPVCSDATPKKLTESADIEGKIKYLISRYEYIKQGKPNFPSFKIVITPRFLYFIPKDQMDIQMLEEKHLEFKNALVKMRAGEKAKTDSA